MDVLLLIYIFSAIKTHYTIKVNLYKTCSKVPPISKDFTYESVPKFFSNTLIIFPRLNGLQQLSPKTNIFKENCNITIDKY